MRYLIDIRDILPESRHQELSVMDPSSRIASRAHTTPVVVSFYSSEAYYCEAAERLRDDCARLRLDHDIVAIDCSATDDWTVLCRRKVPFYLEMHRKHQRPILWLDVDSRITTPLDVFHSAQCDIAGFLRGLRYLRDFDPFSVPRFFSPFALYFNSTQRTTAFLELMALLESRYSGSATDDFFLQEAWQTHRDQLSVMVLPPSLVGREWPLTKEQMFYVGISGNVSKHKGNAQQHPIENLAPARRKAALMFEAELARKSGDTSDALILYKRALSIMPDDALAQKIARLMQQKRSSKLASAPRDHSHPSLWKRWLPWRPFR